MKVDKEGKETSMYVGIFKSIKTCRNGFKESPEINDALMAKNKSKQSEFCYLLDGTELWPVDTGSTDHMMIDNWLLCGSHNLLLVL